MIIRVKVIALLFVKGDVYPYLYWEKWSVNQSGRKYIYMASKIKNNQLLKRAKSELRTADEVEVAIENDKDGGTVLVDFVREGSTGRGKKLQVLQWPTVEERGQQLKKMIGKERKTKEDHSS